MPYEYIATPDGLLTTPPGSPKIMIHTRQGKVVGIYCDGHRLPSTTPHRNSGGLCGLYTFFLWERLFDCQ